ncbi:hypothetical protein HYP06_gp046 [Vibrio phage vB_VspP_pVa5]|uniref:Uncharacterized protein n=1 Tax=Vibrio phage vB_VspP_pVa5 TaxID=1913109 RepID=A0A1J0GV70_9CAUD|nr:hypothetical protein HYP06_gp046 [Vibrio phage vB_VspP_pVa5]APC46082.1 hypothetical protein vBVspPpVa5_0046 [Vibrio phage vB_VspP_pVa5]
MWKLLKASNPHLYMARKGDSYVKFAMGIETRANLGPHRLLDPKHIRISRDPERWNAVLVHDWIDTGHETESLAELHEMAHMVHLMEE